MKRQLLAAYLAVRRFIYIHLLGDQFEREVARWFRDKGDSTLRLSYPLDQNSIVFDCGGYRGDWAASVFECYHPTIYIFEPVKEFYEQILKRFSGQSKICVFHFGLHRRTESTQIMINKNGSSVFCSTGKPEPIMLIDINDFLQEHRISRVNLLKINIEGGEFDLMDRILETGIIHYIDNLQIQFHHFVSNAEERRRSIRERLGGTHRLTYDYAFVWENWAKIEPVLIKKRVRATEFTAGQLGVYDASCSQVGSQECLRKSYPLSVNSISKLVQLLKKVVSK